MTIRLNQYDIEKRIQHRFENQLIDGAEIMGSEGEGRGTLHLCIVENDARNRNLFLKKKFKNQKQVLIPAVCMEILAIGSIVTSGTLKPNQAVFFASIMDFKKGIDATEGVSIHGETFKMSEKASFLKYKGTLTQENQIVAEGNMMAFFLNDSDRNLDLNAKKILPVPLLPVSLPSEKVNQYKCESMMLCDALGLVEADQTVGIYTFTPTHPTHKGHFPGNPVMMGVMQWMTLEDTLLSWARETGHRGSLRGNACLMQTDGVLVAEVKQFEADVWIDDPNYVDQVEIFKIQKIIFRTMVKPNETILIHIQNLEKINQNSQQNF